MKHLLNLKNSILIAWVVVPLMVSAQHAGHEPATRLAIEAQPLLAQALRLEEALSFLGSSLSPKDAARLRALKDQVPGDETTRLIQEILDPYCLAVVSINPEARVKVTRGEAAPKLMQDGWTTFVVKVFNEAHVTAQLEVESPNSIAAIHESSSSHTVKEKDVITHAQVADRFLELLMYRNRPMLPTLSGLGLEYAVVQVYSKDAGQREARIGFNIGEGTQDIGFRNAIHVLFDIQPSVKVTLEVKDDDGSPTMASFLITDGIERLQNDSTTNLSKADFYLAAAKMEYRLPKAPKQLRGIYPLPSRRVAAYDEYPDFYFHPQVYRADGEHVRLPAGTYNVVFTRGPEYLPQTTSLVIPAGVSEYKASFRLKRWIDLSSLGWYSADHHIHAAGCSHYDSPEEGVPPSFMWRQILGEDLNVGASLAWGPSWYHQKTFFTGRDEPFSTATNILHNDVEVSGFPSSHAGHLVLLRLKEDDYPGTTKVEQWPSWTLPVLKWAKSQGAVVGYAHSGWGLEPTEPTRDLPNYVMPKMDGIGANEYIVTVTQNVIDFYSAGDTPPPWELNMWYHTLNAGFTTRLSGETDFPCIYDERVGLGRSYIKPEGKLSYDSYVEALKKGRSYVTDGRSHIIDFKVGGTEVGTGDSKLELKGKKTLKVSARVAAYLPEQQDEAGAEIAERPLNKQPHWHLEHARIGKTRNVRVEMIVNGEPVEAQEIVADGKWKDVNFSLPVSRSCWVALRIYPSSHTNPVFVELNGKPIRVLRSIQWCRSAVDQCWKMKEKRIRESERADARRAYDDARAVYDRLIKEASR